MSPFLFGVIVGVVIGWAASNLNDDNFPGPTGGAVVCG